MSAFRITPIVFVSLGLACAALNMLMLAVQWSVSGSAMPAGAGLISVAVAVAAIGAIAAFWFRRRWLAVAMVLPQFFLAAVTWLGVLLADLLP